MKKLILLLLITSFSYAQEITLNNETGTYGFSEVYDLEKNPNVVELFSKRLAELDYKNIEVAESHIKAKGGFLHEEGGDYFPIEVNYSVFIEFESDKYKITLSEFTLLNPDLGTNAYTLENNRIHKKWAGAINKKLPSILTAIESYKSK